jgi:fumarate hydratase subunit beta
MDAYTTSLIALGLTGMIGKGMRNESVVNAMKEYGTVYFGAIGGAGALISECIKSQEIIAFPELGAEAVRKLYVEDFPLTVLIDCYGNNLYELGRKQFRKK